MALKDKVMYGFIAAAEKTFGAALPFYLHQVVFRQVSHLRRTDPPQILLKETRSGCRQEEEASCSCSSSVAVCPEQREVQLEMLDKPTA